MNNRPQTRLIRTEVIWTKDGEDPNEECPINCCSIRRERKTLLPALLALIIVASHHMISSQLHHDSMTQRLSLGWLDESAIINTTGGLEMQNTAEHSTKWGFGNNLHHKHVPLPEVLDENLADVDKPLDEGDMPYFFHIPRVMGQTINDILRNCVGLNTTNMTATVEDMHTAQKQGINNDVDFIHTQYLHEGVSLFDEKHRGRMFTIIRHPIDRVASMFHYLATAKHEPSYDPDLAHISIEMWSRSKRAKHNWMVRSLSNEMEGALTLEHLDISKEILRKKCIVGLFDEKAESWLRLQRFFGWKFHTHKSRECLDRLLNWGWSTKHMHPSIEEGSMAWNILYERNELDMMLYQYAQILFEEQRALFGEGGSLVH